MKRIGHKSVAILAIGLATWSAPAMAQVGLDTNPGSSIRTRSDLEALLSQYEEVLLSPAYSDAIKAETREGADRIRERLTLGDFRLGDAVVLFVQGEPELPDTVAVQSGAAGPVLTLPLFGDIPLRGVLRSEVEGHITEALRQFIREPIVRAEGLMRVSVQGAVTLPGFYVVPADMLVSQTLMVAGGPAPNAAYDDLRVERGAAVLIGGDDLAEAVRQGRTLDQLNLQAGDQFVMPEQGGGLFSNVGIIIGILTSVTLVVIQATR